MSDKILLHGKLNVEIKSARDIPNFDRYKAWLDWGNDTDAHVQVVLGHDTLIKTKTVLDTSNPVWNESYVLDVCHFSTKLKVVLWDNDCFDLDEKIGSVEFLAGDLLNGEQNEGWYDIKSDDGQSVNGQINVLVQYTAHKVKEDA